MKTKKEKDRESSAKWRAANPEKVRLQQANLKLKLQTDAEYKASVYAKNSNYLYKKRYGISHEDRDQMLIDQEYKCAICGSPNPNNTDHCHKTGKVRAMLCIPCNYFLGKIEKLPDKGKKYIDYIEHHNKKNGVT